MSSNDAASEPSLFDSTTLQPAIKTPVTLIATEDAARAASNAAKAAPAKSEPAVNAASSEAAASGASGDVPSSDVPEAGQATEVSGPTDRKRLAEQLDALKRKEFELRRALAAADHPELADAIRLLEGRAFSVSRVEAKIAQGFSKTEARRREVIEKKLGTLRDKRAELDSQIGALETELTGLGADRLTAFQREREGALQELLRALGTHEAALRAAGLDSARLVPEIEGWMPELEALATKVSAASA